MNGATSALQLQVKGGEMKCGECGTLIKVKRVIQVQAVVNCETVMVMKWEGRREYSIVGGGKVWRDGGIIVKYWMR